MWKILAPIPSRACPKCSVEYTPIGANGVVCGRCFALAKHKKRKLEDYPLGTCVFCEREEISLFHRLVPVCFVCLTAPERRVALIQRLSADLAAAS